MNALRCHKPWGLVLLLFAWGCASEEDAWLMPEEPAVVATTHRRVGTLVAEVDSTDALLGTGFHVHAQFVDVRGLSPQAALEALEVWAPPAGLGDDHCVLRPADRWQPLQGAPLAELHLLDVGSIRVEHALGEHILEPRFLPELASTFSGVIYAHEASDELRQGVIDYLPLGSYRLSAPGRGATGGFAVEVTAPRPVVLESVEVGESAGRDLVLRWSDGWQDSPESGAGPESWPVAGEGASRLYLDVVRTGGAPGGRLNCVLEDDGQFAVPSGWLSAVARSGEPVELVLRRVHRVALAMEGVEEATVALVARDARQLRLP